MNDLPAPTAEGELIRQARDLAIPRLSIRAAAARIGMSPEHWGNVERGYRYTKQDDPTRSFAAPAATIAKMASAVGVTPDQLAEVGREDAARLLEEILRAKPDGSRKRELPTITAILATPGIERYRAVVDAERDGGFPPRDEDEARIWDEPKIDESEKRALVSYRRLVWDEAVRSTQQQAG
jgi:transcriptional regulator with XRE-family HTH domain